jgi:hypothetical protein
MNIDVTINATPPHADADCDASTLLPNAETVGDCTATLSSGSDCTNTGSVGFVCTPSSCLDGVLSPGLCGGIHDVFWHVFVLNVD